MQAAAVGFLLVLPPRPALGEKTDVVVFDNGDRLTGEVKKLERGKLAFKTDATDTIQIEWEDVRSLHSEERFDVETESGERYFGAAAAAEDERLQVVGDAGSWTLDLPAIVRLTPIEDGFWKRLDGHIDAGFSFTQSDDRTQLSFSAAASQRTQKYLRRLTFNAITASQRGVDETNRDDLNLTITRFLKRPKRLFITVASLQHNEELGIDLRALAGAAAGWRMIQTNTEILTLLSGASVTRESLDGAGASQESLEALLGLGFESFQFDRPKRDVNVTFTVFPSASDFGRVRSELNAKVRWEVARDLFFGLTLLHSYDSEPPTEEAEKSDVSLTTSFGWSF